MMVNFGEKAKIKKAGNLNSGRSYVTTTASNSYGQAHCLGMNYYVIFQQ